MKLLEWSNKAEQAFGSFYRYGRLLESDRPRIEQFAIANPFKAKRGCLEVRAWHVSYCATHPTTPPNGQHNMTNKVILRIPSSTVATLGGNRVLLEFPLDIDAQRFFDWFVQIDRAANRGEEISVDIVSGEETKQ